MSTSEHTLAPGVVVGGDFRVLGPLAAGGMGAVYVAEQGSTARRRALKVMRRDLVGAPGIAERFVLEARVAARIRSDHVVEVIAAGFDPALGAPWLAMELLEGTSLDALIRERGPLPRDQAAMVLEQVGAGLAAAHDAGVVHRDLKPENVFVSTLRDAGRGLRVKILDFGIAKVLAEATASTPMTVGVGTPRWMAPEQTESSIVSPATDVWALGLVAYHVLTGRYFWRSAAGGEGSHVGQLLREVLADPIPLASVRAAEQGVGGLVPPGFDAWLARCLQRSPHHRFASARYATAALAPVLAGATGGAASHDGAGPSAVTGRGAATGAPATTGGGVVVRPRTPRGAGRRGLVAALVAVGSLVTLAAIAAVVAHVQLDAFGLADVDPPAPPATPEVILPGVWLIGEGRSARGISYSGHVNVAPVGPTLTHTWTTSYGANILGLGLVDGTRYAVAWGDRLPYGLYLYDVRGGRLDGRIVTTQAQGLIETETLEGPPSLEGTFRITASQTGRGGTMTLRRDGARYLVTRTTDFGVVHGVALLDAARLVVAVAPEGIQVGAVSYQVEPTGTGMTGILTDTLEPGVGREILARR